MAKTKLEIPQFDNINSLATDILKNARNSITVDLRFFDLASSKLEFVPFPGMKQSGNRARIDPLAPEMIATDGERFYYEPTYIIKRYRYDRQVIARDFLHSLLHCIFRHMNNPEKDATLWNLACDIAVEQALNDFEVQHISISRIAWQKPLIEKMKADGLDFFGAEKIYAYLRKSNITPEKLAELVSAFEADSHDAWYKEEIVIYVRVEGDADGNDGSNVDSGEADGDGNRDNSKGNGKNADDDGDGEGKDGNNGNRSGMRYKGVTTRAVPKTVLARDPELSRQWENISRSLASDLENFSKEYGSGAGNLCANLGEVNRERYDYTAFLRRFSVLGEAMKLNDDEFDYIPYSYGLTNYKNMPFIEPLEYKDVKRIRDFVIAIDTSGSVYGDQVRRFLQKTYNILKSSESFFSRVNIHLIQCDSEISEAKKIDNLSELEEYIANFKIKGGGGTSFVPVFDYINKKIAEHEFTNLKGMIYFTDGYGEFPSKKPQFDAAFVFVEDNPRNIPDLPPWAIKIVLSNSDVEKL